MYTVPKYRMMLVREGELSYARRFITDADAAKAVAKSILSLEPVECVLSIYLSIDGTVIGAESVARGGADACACTPAEVFRGAIIAGARSIIVAHNHPSGSTLPSLNDIGVTSSLIEAGRTLGIPLLDHLIVGRDMGEGVHVASLRDTHEHLPWQS